MEYKKDDRVLHPSMKEWGLGAVLEDSKGDNVRIFFVGAGERTISLQHVQPEKVSATDAAHPILDNLKISKTSSGIKYQSLPQSKSYFLEKFPEGFYGERFKEEERDYKIHAHDLALDLLDRDAFYELLQNKEYADICKRALKVVNATNLIFPNEKMALKDGLALNEAQQSFSENLYELLYGEEALEKRFISFASMLEEIEADKWTTASYFLFIIHPDRFMFVKPTITQHASELCCFEINYSPRLNWLTYKSVLKFSEVLKEAISDLNPRDMIDVQSFMWCIAPGTYEKA
jgi:Protein of unknown function (DUF3553)